jgi:hypothetical protein
MNPGGDARRKVNISITKKGTLLPVKMTQKKDIGWRNISGGHFVYTSAAGFQAERDGQRF